MKPAVFFDIAMIQYGREKAIEIMTGVNIPEEVYALARGANSDRQSDGTWRCNLSEPEIKKLVLAACRLADEEKDRQEPTPKPKKHKKYASPYKSLLNPDD